MLEMTLLSNLPWAKLSLEAEGDLARARPGLSSARLEFDPACGPTGMGSYIDDIRFEKIGSNVSDIRSDHIRPDIDDVRSDRM